MASGPIPSWQIDGETMETVTDFIYLGSRITADGDCSHEIKRRLLFARKAMINNLDSILKSRDIILLTKVYLVKAIVFPVGMYICESWTINKAEHQRTDVFELWCFRRVFFFFLILQTRHRCIEQTFGLCGRGRGWDDLGEWH